MKLTSIFIIVAKSFGGFDMDINRRKFLQLAGTATLALSFGKVHAAAGEKILVV